MFVVEITLLVIAYTLLIITIFLEIICYKRNLESAETIALTVSLLLLIISLTLSPLLNKTDSVEHTNIFTLLSMVLVGLTTPLNVLTERQHKVPAIWKKILIAISLLLLLSLIAGYFVDALDTLQYIAVAFLGISVVLSMLLVRFTKPQKKILHREKTERIFAIALMVIVPLSLLVNYVFIENYYSLKIGFTLPLVFILLAGNKLMDDLQRLSLVKSPLNPQEQHLKNYALTPREKEIALILSTGITYKQISEELHISMPTVKTHASNIYKKCGVKSRSELTALLIN